MVAINRFHVSALLISIFISAAAACVPAERSAIADDRSSVTGADRPARAGAAVLDPYAHESLLAPPTEAAPRAMSAEAMAELERLPVPYDLNRLPVIYDQAGKLRVAEMPAVSQKADPTDPETNLNASSRALYVVGGSDWVTYYYIEIPLPSYMTDFDGGTIRLVMQHELDSYDQVRVIDEHIGTEYVNDAYGARGHFPGRYGWTRQSGGGEFSWILGDGSPHNLANPWDWAWVLDYRWLQGNSVLGGDTIRIYSHPHVTTRVSLID